MIKFLRKNLDKFVYLLSSIGLIMIILLKKTNVDLISNLGMAAGNRLSILIPHLIFLNFIMFILIISKYFFPIKLKRFYDKIALLSSKFKFKNHLKILILSTLFLIIYSRYLFTADISEIFQVNDYKATHWLINYQDFGFIKRGLAGSLIKSVFNEINLLNIIVLCTLIFLLIIILTFQLIKKTFPNLNYSDKLLILTFFTSPGFILALFMDNGRFDQVCLILMILSVIFLISGITTLKILVVSLFTSIGLLVHEAYLILNFPLVFLITFFKLYENFKKSKNLLEFKSLIILLILPIFTGIALLNYGYVTSIELNDIVKTLESYNVSFLDLGIVTTFSYNPFYNLMFFQNSFCTDKILCPAFTLTSFLIYNFLFLIFFFIFLKNFKKRYFKNYKFLFFSIILMLIFIFSIRHIITFVDYYRVYSTLLFLMFVLYIYLKFKFKKITYLNKVSKKNFPYILTFILLINFNFYLIQIASMHNTSSIDPVNRLLFFIFN